MTILDNILAAIVAALVIALGVVLVMNADLRADLATVNANAFALSRANTDLKSAVEKQNRALALLQVASAAKTHAAEKAVKAASLHAQRAKTKAAAIAKEPVANGSAKDDCAAATQILRDYLKDR